MIRHLPRWTALLTVSGAFVCPVLPAQEGILATNFFNNTVDLYDAQTGQLIKAGFFDPGVALPNLLGFAGIAVDQPNHRAYVSGRFSDQIYVFDTRTGQPVGSGEFQQLVTGSQPAGLALSASGNLYVANNGGSSVDVFNTTTGELVKSISDGGNLLYLPSGLTFNAMGDLYITTSPTLMAPKVLRYSERSLTAFTEPAEYPFVPNEIEILPNGEVFVADVFSNGVFKYDAHGNEIAGRDGAPFINIDWPPPSGSAHGVFAPSGLALYDNGDLLVSLMGPTNPFNPPYEVHGALLRFSAVDGTLLQELGTGLAPYSAVAFLAEVPEPQTLTLALTGFVAAAWLGLRRRRRDVRRAHTPIGHGRC